MEYLLHQSRHVATFCIDDMPVFRQAAELVKWGESSFLQNEGQT
jgi:hypothetical protein